jgi:hypothetical protein
VIDLLRALKRSRRSKVLASSHMSWPLFINVSSAIYARRNLMDCANTLRRSEWAR